MTDQRFGATILDAAELRLSVEEKALFRDVNPFGFILFARNIDNPDQVRALCDDFRDCVGHNAPITIDQEGGRVQRLRAPVWREWFPPLEFVDAAGGQATRAMYLRYRLIADELFELGIDSNCAPMVDVAGPQTHDFLRNRCYGNDAMQVAALGRAAADGMLAGGVLPVVKHIPGHGRATADSHFDLPRVSAPRADLDAVDFAPFKALADLPMGMTAHLVYDAIDEAPATLSKPVMQVIREDIGFDNLIMTDDISMKALEGTLTDLSRGALEAGCDVILHCNGTLAERAEVAVAAGEMTDAAQTRALRALDARRTPDDIDIPALQSELEALLGGALHG
ncbi:glycoside hydrolase family 3 N-terminal domain-containing protein [Sulfitobacter sp. SK012]|uniref:glycoside hydrolase family 3 N-terminal domain-containing protein n=1 Tax=Sulfitobacter sp. SK012 TaxID=1389005 RepID=UPI0020C7F17D|nr:glycoside hydrolase family 3 N-terminal domain-containing protein [Sulfitobacter sp. SK012]